MINEMVGSKLVRERIRLFIPEEVREEGVDELKGFCELSKVSILDFISPVERKFSIFHTEI